MPPKPDPIYGTDVMKPWREEVERVYYGDRPTHFPYLDPRGTMREETEPLAPQLLTEAEWARIARRRYG